MLLFYFSTHQKFARKRVVGQDMPAGAQLVTYPSLDTCAEALAGNNLDVELLQLAPGSGEVSIRTTPCRSLTVQRIKIDAPAVRRGTLNPRVISFAVWDERRPQEGAWCGSPMGTAGVSVFPDDFSATGRHRLNGTIVEAEPSRCLDTAALLEIDLPPDWRTRSVIYPLGRQQLDSLARDLNFLESGVDDPDRELRVLGTVIGALSQSAGRRPRASQRARAFSVAREYIEQSGPEIPVVTDICRAAGVSLRTLEYAFREYVDMTPVQYLKVYRLNQVRKLLTHGQTAKVADAANAWGFWHMGSFAADYRDLYGVKPSFDLRVALAPSANID